MRLALVNFKEVLQGEHVMVMSDNKTAVAYINKQGGTHSPALCMKTWSLLLHVQSLGCTLSAAHLAGCQNAQADFLSRKKVDHLEGTLNDLWVKPLFQSLGRPLIDLFASDLNFKLPTFCSWKESRLAYQIDAFAMNWDNLRAYAYPPIFLIPRISQKMIA